MFDVPVSFKLTSQNSYRNMRLEKKRTSPESTLFLCILFSAGGDCSEVRDCNVCDNACFNYVVLKSELRIFN